MSENISEKAIKIKEARTRAAKKSSSNVHEHVKKQTPEQRAKTAAKRRKPQLKPSKWREMEALWESGEVTLSELSERFSMDGATISRHMTVNGIVKGAKAEEYGRLIREKIAVELAGDATEHAKRIKEMKERYIDYNEVLARLARNELVNVRNKSLPLHTAMMNIKTLNEAAKLFATTRSENWALLNVMEFDQRVEKDDMPELLISELTVEDVEKMRVEQERMSVLTGESLDVNALPPSDDELYVDEIVEEVDE